MSADFEMEFALLLEVYPWTIVAGLGISSRHQPLSALASHPHPCAMEHATRLGLF